MSDLAIYRQLIDKAAESDSTELLPNAGQAHAAIVMAKMFDKTTTSVRMLVGKFEGPVSNQSIYLDSLTRCLENKVQFKIIFSEDPNEESKAFQLLQAEKVKHPDRICFAYANNIASLSFNPKQTHFAVFDDNKYRFEKDTKNYLAWVCFNDKKSALHLSNIFDKLYADLVNN